MCSQKLSFFLLLFVILLHCNKNLIFVCFVSSPNAIAKSDSTWDIGTPSFQLFATHLPKPLNLPPIDSQCDFTNPSKVRLYLWDRTHKASPRICSSKQVHSVSELQSIQWFLVQHKCNFFTHISVDRYRVQEAKITSRKRAVPVTAPVNLWGKNQIGPKTLGLA